MDSFVFWREREISSLFEFWRDRGRFYSWILIRRCTTTKTSGTLRARARFGSRELSLPVVQFSYMVLGLRTSKCQLFPICFWYSCNVSVLSFRLSIWHFDIVVLNFYPLGFFSHFHFDLQPHIVKNVMLCDLLYPLYTYKQYVLANNYFEVETNLKIQTYTVNHVDSAKSYRGAEAKVLGSNLASATIFF